MRLVRRVAAWAAAMTLVACGEGINDPYMVYPESAAGDQVDDYHGVRVPDPYRWLEDTESPATQAWIAAQNAHTERYIGFLKQRPYFEHRLRKLLDYERAGVPEREAGVYVYTYNPGDAEQDAIWVTTDPAEPGRVLVDPEAFSADGTVSLGEFALSRDGRLLAYSLSDGGSDWRRWRVREVASGKDLTDELEGIKFSEVAWAPDNAGFYYSRYPAAEQGGYDDSRQVAIYYHALGQVQSEDALIFEITDHPTRNPYATVSEDGRYLLIDLFDGYETSGLYYRELGDPAASVVRLLDEWDARYEFVGNLGGTFFVQTTREAPRGRLVAIDLEQPEPAAWREIVPEASEAIQEVRFAGERFFVSYLKDARSRVLVFALDGAPLGELGLPGSGTVGGLAGKAAHRELFFEYTDFTTPRTIYRDDLGGAPPRPLRVPNAGIDTRRFVTEQVFYTSRDGTRVPMFIVRRSDVVPDGRRPTVLYGYGGFNVSLSPAYSSARMAWIEAGGIYAQASLRGGGEYGEAWHLAGTKLNKQNVFDDFIAAAEWLIANGYTRPAQLAIWGGSNGGLLVGAVANQRPGLFAAAVPAVGVMDMLRYQTASANARQWSTDYGLSENPEQFRALYAYSPYHNIADETCYPATLVQADTHDDRVAPWHSYKYAARLQKAQGCSRPVLIRIETRSGHGAGASLSKIVDEYADQWAFVAHVVGLKLPGIDDPGGAGD